MPDRALRLLVAAQVAAILVLGAVTVARFPIWAEVDERAHYAVIQALAEDGRLAGIDDVVSPEVQAITDRTFPARSPRDPAAVGLAGRAYEAFQPPLYYVLATPAFLVPVDHHAKVRVLRVFDLALLAVALALLLALARELFGARYRAPLALALCVLLWPGVLVRLVTISNTALELPLALAVALALCRARSPRGVAVAAALLGALMLTKLTLAALVVPLAGVALLVARRERRPRVALAALLIPGLLLLPWLAFNLDRYGTLTANAQALAQQLPVLYPGGQTLGAADIPARLASLPRGALPQEWVAQLDRPAIGLAARALPLALLAFALAGIARRPAMLRTRAAGVLAAPVALVLVTMALTLALERHDIFLMRYLIPILPGLALFAALAWPGDRAPARLALAGTVVAGALWVWMAGSYFFIDLGQRLGIG